RTARARYAAAAPTGRPTPSGGATTPPRSTAASGSCARGEAGARTAILWSAASIAALGFFSPSDPKPRCSPHSKAPPPQASAPPPEARPPQRPPGPPLVRRPVAHPPHRPPPLNVGGAGGAPRHPRRPRRGRPQHRLAVLLPPLRVLAARVQNLIRRWRAERGT